MAVSLGMDYQGGEWKKEEKEQKEHEAKLFSARADQTSGG